MESGVMIDKQGQVNRLVDLMINKPQSMNWYAREIGIAPQTLKRLLDGIYPNNLETLCKIEQFLRRCGK